MVSEVFLELRFPLMRYNNSVYQRFSLGDLEIPENLSEWDTVSSKNASSIDLTKAPKEDIDFLYQL